MTEQTFRSPNFYEQEIDLSQRETTISGVPAGVLGSSLKGPAFVPIAVSSYDDFAQKFGSLDPKYAAPYAVKEWLKHKSSAVFMRILGAGANDTTDDISNTRTTGKVKNAGFVVTGTTVGGGELRHQGSVQFLCAQHVITTNETLGMPLFTDNDSYVATSASDNAYVLRGVLFTASGTRIMVMNGYEALPTNVATLDDVATLDTSNKFKLVISSSARITQFTASFDPSSTDYYGKVLNTNPEKFAEQEHLLYADFAVDAEVAAVATTSASIAIVSGSAASSAASGVASLAFRNAFGHYDTRYQSAKTTYIISQPFGNTEYDLFYFEALDDGDYPNERFKISIANLRGSTDPANEYGTFTVQVRRWDDTDTAPQIIEQFPGCTLNPDSEDYVARRIGDRKTKYNFDADSEEERRLITEGKYSNKSTVVRIVMNESVDRKLVPGRSLPFGFRGIQSFKTNDTLTDSNTSNTAPRIGGVLGASVGTALSASIVPPLPFRFKVTRGNVSTTGFAGNPGVTEEVDGRYYWGVKFERNKDPLNSNTTKEKNDCVRAYSKMIGLTKLDVLVTGSSVDSFNENKFTLSRVAFPQSAISGLTGTVAEHMKEVAYIRNGNPDSSQYRVSDGVLTSRITLGTLIAQTSSAEFNRFTDFTKFTTILQGGFNGLNILDRDAARMNDKSCSSDTNGGASSGFTSPGLAINPAGTGKNNNAVFSFRTAAKIMVDPYTLIDNAPTLDSINLLAIPGIRDTFVTDYVAQKTKESGFALYIMDLVNYDDDSNRLFDDSSSRPDIETTSQQFDSRAIDNSYVSTYFPDVTIRDDVNNRRIKVPSSVAALAALAYNDRVGFPWFAPAGFNRGALDFVTGLSVRLTTGDRDTLYDSRINPIANFPNGGNEPVFVIFGQKTLQQTKSALDRVNVRRLMLEVKRTIKDIAKTFVFEANTAATRAKFVSLVVPRLGLIQSQAGIEKFDVVIDERNNSTDDVEQNRMNVKIEVVPTRTAENISIDFIITNSGFSFED